MRNHPGLWFRAIAMAVMMLVPAWTATSRAQSDDLVTDYEKSGYKATPRYAETIDYCKRLAGASRWLRYTTFGVSPQGRELPLIIADKHEHFTPKRVRGKGKAVLLIQAGIHAGEIDGKEAGFMLLRDIAVRREYVDFLDHVAIVFIPIFSVDGHERFGPYNRINQNGPEEMGWRVTAQNLNLNRDYLKADTPEMQAWLKLWNDWQPDFFIDCHVTDGADYQYVMTYGLEIYGGMAPSLTNWVRESYLHEVGRAMATSGFELFPYISLLQWPDPKGGMKSGVASPRFSTGYTAIHNRPGLLIETHMLKDYKTRVAGTYELLKNSVELLNREYAGLKKAIAEAERYTASPEFRREPFALDYEPDSNGVDIDFKGFEYTSRKSDLTGGRWLEFTGEPETFRIKWLNKQVPSVVADLPEAYIVPAEWQTVIERLELLGVEFERLSRAQTLTVDSYRFQNPEWKQQPFEGRHRLTVTLEKITEERTFAPGSAVIDMNQPAARVAAHVLEPEAPDSYVRWGFFDAIFEQKEYAESYVMEKMAREMLANDPGLRSEFEAKKKDDP
ncbi:MAG: M14 family metallopeptidase, partial [Candidatus Krumholzibacteriia bacterium]